MLADALPYLIPFALGLVVASIGHALRATWRLL